MHRNVFDPRGLPPLRAHRGKYPGQSRAFLQGAWKGDGVAPARQTRQMKRRALMEQWALTKGGAYIADKRARRLAREAAR